MVKIINNGEKASNKNESGADEKHKITKQSYSGLTKCYHNAKLCLLFVVLLHRHANND